MRVLHGVTGAAGQPHTIARYQRRLGIHAESVMIGSNVYAFEADRRIELGVDALATYSEFLASAIHEFDVFHFYFRPLFYFDSARPAFPTALDLLLLRASGKTVIFHFRGSEVRTAERFRELSPFNYVDENPSRIFTKFPTHAVDTMTGFISAIANKVLVPDEELQSYVPGSHVVRRAVSLEDLPRPKPRRAARPMILHAPTRPVVKGTEHVLASVSELTERGYEFDFELVENRPHHEALDLYRRADIVIDQLRIGWYGVLAVEAMALGKAVVAFIRDDLVQHLGDDPPLAVASPTNLTQVLALLLDSPARVEELGLKGRRFVEGNHDATGIAGDLIELYRSPEVLDHRVDSDAVLEFLQAQMRYTGRAVRMGREDLTRSRDWSSKVEKFRYVAETYGYRTAAEKALAAILPRRRNR